MTEHEYLNSHLDERNLIQIINQLQLRWSKTLLQALGDIVKPGKKFGEWIDRVYKFDGEKWEAARIFSVKNGIIMIYLIFYRLY